MPFYPLDRFCIDISMVNKNNEIKVISSYKDPPCFYLYYIKCDIILFKKSPKIDLLFFFKVKTISNSILHKSAYQPIFFSVKLNSTIIF